MPCPLALLAVPLCFALAPHPAHRFNIDSCGLGIGSLLLCGPERRVVATPLLCEHALCIVLAVIRTEAFTSSAVFTLGSATPILR